MINAQELRYGNKLLFLDDVVTFKNITEFREDGIYWINPVEPKIEAKSFHFKPIELTEEWHNKFGVSKNGFNQFEYALPEKNNFHIKVIFNDDYVMLRQGGINQKPLDDDLISVWNRDLVKRDMYVHEWQNLYFSLTGKELTIKE
jgi:hypothetical protein